jgi:hypothetical protein
LTRRQRDGRGFTQPMMASPETSSMPFSFNPIFYGQAQMEASVVLRKLKRPGRRILKKMD